MHKQDCIDFEELGQRELMKGALEVIVKIVAAAALIIYCLDNPNASACRGDLMI